MLPGGADAADLGPHSENRSARSWGLANPRHRLFLSCLAQFLSFSSSLFFILMKSYTFTPLKGRKNCEVHFTMHVAGFMIFLDSSNTFLLATIFFFPPGTLADLVPALTFSLQRVIVCFLYLHFLTCAHPPLFNRLILEPLVFKFSLLASDPWISFHVLLYAVPTARLHYIWLRSIFLTISFSCPSVQPCLPKKVPPSLLPVNTLLLEAFVFCTQVPRWQRLWL